MESQQRKITQICAFIDVEGFVFGENFHIREFFLISADREIHCEIDPALPPARNNNYPQYIRKQLYQQSTKHGLKAQPDRPLLINSSQIVAILKTAHTLLATEEKPIFAFQNKNLANICDRLRIPYTIFLKSDIQVQHTACDLHKKSYNKGPGELNCAEARGRSFWKWHQENSKEAPITLLVNGVTKMKLSTLPTGQVMDWE